MDGWMDLYEWSKVTSVGGCNCGCKNRLCTCPWTLSRNRQCNQISASEMAACTRLLWLTGCLKISGQLNTHGINAAGASEEQLWLRRVQSMASGTLGDTGGLAACNTELRWQSCERV